MAASAGAGFWLVKGAEECVRFAHPITRPTQGRADPARRLQWTGFPVRAAAPAARTLRTASAAPGATSSSSRLRKACASAHAALFNRSSYVSRVIRSSAPIAPAGCSGFGCRRRRHGGPADRLHRARRGRHAARKVGQRWWRAARRPHAAHVLAGRLPGHVSLLSLGSASLSRDAADVSQWCRSGR